MSEATERPVDDDAWASACAEDLAAEKARRRAEYGPPPGAAAEELRKLVDAVADKIAAFGSPLFGMAAQGAVRQVVKQARSVVEPVVERNPGVFDHLAAAGGELLAAYRSAVETQERRWTQGDRDGQGDRDSRGDRDGRGTGAEADGRDGAARSQDSGTRTDGAKGTDGPRDEGGPRDGAGPGDDAGPRDEGQEPSGHIPLD
ncbi:DUF5304 domain-containing protein [Streptomyces sp. DT24]|uniref:DUF5304 domain-containing protein n=1 Tax=Streptomyces sp. DT24 TaxID=3416520 RepID=UPI003CEB7855